MVARFDSLLLPDTTEYLAWYPWSSWIESSMSCLAALGFLNPFPPTKSNGPSDSGPCQVTPAPYGGTAARGNKKSSGSLYQLCLACDSEFVVVMLGEGLTGQNTVSFITS